jgi:hypothetical protein
MSNTVLKEVIEEIIWSRKCKHFSYRVATLSELRRVWFGVALGLSVIVKFLKSETYSFERNMSTKFHTDSERNKFFAS